MAGKDDRRQRGLFPICTAAEVILDEMKKSTENKPGNIIGRFSKMHAKFIDASIEDAFKQNAENPLFGDRDTMAVFTETKDDAENLQAQFDSLRDRLDSSLPLVQAWTDDTIHDGVVDVIDLEGLFNDCCQNMCTLMKSMSKHINTVQKDLLATRMRNNIDNAQATSMFETVGSMPKSFTGYLRKTGIVERGCQEHPASDYRPTIKHSAVNDPTARDDKDGVLTFISRPHRWKYDETTKKAPGLLTTVKQLPIQTLAHSHVTLVSASRKQASGCGPRIQHNVRVCPVWFAFFAIHLGPTCCFEWLIDFSLPGSRFPCLPYASHHEFLIRWSLLGSLGFDMFYELLC